MPYARLDDRYDDHRKIKRALRCEPAAVAVHAMAITYCNRHNTDGEIDADTVEEWLSLMPYKSAQRKRVIATLLDRRLFERLTDDTFLVHDFLDWNLSSAQRKALAEQGRRGGHAKASGSSPPDGDGSSHRSSQGHSQGLSPGHSEGHSQGLSPGSSTPTPTPTPTPSQERPSASADGVAAAPPRTQEQQAVDDLCHLMSHHVRTTHGIDPASKEACVTSGWRNACRAMLTLDGYNREQIAYAIEWVCRHHYWRNRIKSMTRLRSEMGQVSNEIRAQKERTNVVPMHQRPSAGDLILKLRDAEEASA